MLLVSAGLRGRLELEDWKTYLSWHYLQHKPRQTWYVAQPTIRALLPLLVFIAVAANLTFNVGQYLSGLFGSIFGPPVLLFVVYQLGPATRMPVRRNCASVSTISLVTLRPNLPPSPWGWISLMNDGAMVES